MPLSRREFLGAAAAAAVVPSFRSTGAPMQAPQALPAERFDPWIEVDPEALRYNVRVLSRLAGGKPILAVVKNNAYGLGLATVGRVLDRMPEVAGLAVVKAAEAIALRDAAVRKPVLLMALHSDADGPELVARGVTLTACTDDALDRARRAGARSRTPVSVVAMVDTGMNRIGVPYHRAPPWLAEIAADSRVALRGTMTDLAEDREFDLEQLRRFRSVAEAAGARGLSLGPLHAAASDAVFNTPGSTLDMIRPGITLYGAYPSDEGRERAIAELRPAVRLRARVVRVEQLRQGDSVSYGRHYVAQRPVWTATLPVGHVDGVPRTAVRGAGVLINGRVFPAIGAVSASHTIVELGAERTVSIGDVATVLGPDDPAIHPNSIATSAGVSVYDVLMHLSAALPRYVV